MPNRLRALITPSVLVWAREHLQLTQETAARKAGVSLERFTEWEAGRSAPTVRQARLLAAALRQPFAAFFLEAPPDIPLRVPHDYRRMGPPLDEEASSEILASIQDSMRRREITLDLMSAARLEPTRLTETLRIAADPERAGLRVRALLNISEAEQVTWREPRIGFNGWRRAAEAIGVLVFQAEEIDVQQFRGYSLASQPLPVVVVNRKDAYAARSFTLIHEIAHVLLNKEGLCDLHSDTDATPEDRATEVFCNAVAAACLMPSNPLLSHYIIAGAPRQLTWSDEQIAELARYFSVSREALLRRLLTLGHTTQQFYERKRNQYLEAVRLLQKRKGFPPPHQDALSKLGRPFVRLVLDSYAANRVTSSDASDYLGLKLKHFPALLDVLRGA